MTGLAWNPSYPRQFVVSYIDNNGEIWDLRQPKTPKFTFKSENARTILDMTWSKFGI